MKNIILMKVGSFKNLATFIQNFITCNLELVLTWVEFFLEVAIWYLIPDMLYR